MKRLMSLVAFGLGYLLGSRAGRERYDQIMRGLTRVREDPRVDDSALASEGQFPTRVG
jgi:hypothetical protein